ncbi:MAG: hypothetical protein M1831_001372 [Alyxoria varia]|nr:MAG: hypothetical protein M1831_001372 [Alyxoria varia]
MTTQLHDSLFQWGSPTSNENQDAEQSVDFAMTFLEKGYEKPISAQSTLNTPPPSSPNNDVTASPSRPTHEKPSKQIRFDPVPNVCGHSAYDDPNPAPAVNLRVLLPSRKLTPFKSILKPPVKSTSFSSTTTEDIEAPRSPHQFASFVDMLESLVKQLAGGSRGAKLDAYNTLCNSLRAYQDNPDLEALTAKLPLLESFIQRDMGLRKIIQEPLDTRLVLLALKLAMILLGEKLQVAGHCSQEFCDWVIDDAITVADARDVSKELFKFYLCLLSLPQLCSMAMNAHRAKRTLMALTNASRKIAGDSILEGELRIYSRLIDYAKSFMALSIREWLPKVVHDMLGNSGDISNRAIEVGMKAATAFGSHREGTEAMHTFLNQQTEGSSTNFDHIHEALLRNTSRASTRSRVPRIWTVVVLFLRSNSHELERWPLSIQWLLIIQKCFNTSDTEVQNESWIAWNQYIRAIDPGYQTQVQTIKTLSSPMIGTLSRLDRHRGTADEKKAALASFTMLLYYGFRPTASAEQIRLYWDQCLRRVILSVTANINKAKSPRVLVRICRHLASAFSASSLKTWSPQKSYERNVAEKELPRLDPQWIRHNILDILNLVEGLVGLEVDIRFGAHRDFVDARHQLWCCLLKAISDAGSKEIKITKDAKNAVAAVCTTVCRLSRIQHIASVRLDEDVRNRYVSHCWELIKQMIKEFDASLVFQPIIHELADGNFEGASTPTRADGESSSKAERPVAILTREISSMLLVLNVDDTSAFDAETFRNCMKSCTTNRSKLELLKDCAYSISPAVMTANGNEVLTRTWQMFMQLFQETLPTVDPEEHNLEEAHFVHEYQQAIQILQVAPSATNVQIWERSMPLIQSISFHLAKRLGQSGATLILVIPFLRTLNDESAGTGIDSTLSCASWLLKNAIKRPTQVELSEAYKSIPDGDTLPADGFGWFNRTCQVVDKLLSVAYVEQTRISWSSLQQYLQAVAYFAQSPECFAPEYFVHAIQRGLTLWSKDESRCTSPSIFTELLLPLWHCLLEMVEKLPVCDEVFQKLQKFFTVGFQSVHKTLAMSTAQTWNATFAKKRGLNYTADISIILRRLRWRGVIDMDSNMLPISGEDEHQASDAELFPWLFDAEYEEACLASCPEHGSHEQEQVEEQDRNEACLSSGSFGLDTRFAPVDSSPISFSGESTMDRCADRAASQKQKEGGDFEDIPSSPLGYLSERLGGERRASTLANDEMPSLHESLTSALNAKAAKASNASGLKSFSAEDKEDMILEHDVIIEDDLDQPATQSCSADELQSYGGTALDATEKTVNGGEDMNTGDASQLHSEPVLRLTEANGESINGDAKATRAPTRSLEIEGNAAPGSPARAITNAPEDGIEDTEMDIKSSVDGQLIKNGDAVERDFQLQNPPADFSNVEEAPYSPDARTTPPEFVDNTDGDMRLIEANAKIYASDFSSEPIQVQKPTSDPVEPLLPPNAATSNVDSPNQRNPQFSVNLHSPAKENSMKTLENDARVSDSFTLKVKPPSRDPPSDNSQASEASPTSSFGSFPFSPDIIRALSQSPHQENSPRVLVPATDQKHTRTTMTLRSRTNRSSSASQDTPAVPKKRKAETSKAKPAPKRARGISQAPKSSKLPNQSVEETPNMGDTIVLERSTKDTPSFHEVVEQIKSSASSQASPSVVPAKRNGRRPTPSGKNKRKLDESTESDEFGGDDTEESVVGHDGPTEKKLQKSNASDKDRPNKRSKLNDISDGQNKSSKARKSPRQPPKGKGEQIKQVTKSPVAPTVVDDDESESDPPGRKSKETTAKEKTAEAKKAAEAKKTAEAKNKPAEAKTANEAKQTSPTPATKKPAAATKTPPNKKSAVTKKTPSTKESTDAEISPTAKGNQGSKQPEFKMPQTKQTKGVKNAEEPKQVNGTGNSEPLNPANGAKKIAAPKQTNVATPAGKERKTEGPKNSSAQKAGPSKNVSPGQKNPKKQEPEPMSDSESDDDQSFSESDEDESALADVSDSPTAVETPGATNGLLEDIAEGEDNVDEGFDQSEASSQASAPIRAADSQLLRENQDSGQYSSSFSPAKLARSAIGRLWNVLDTCKKLSLRGSEYQGEREELEDASTEVQREIMRAGRRGE